MDTARQFLRWSIPGSTLIVILGATAAANAVATEYVTLARHRSLTLTPADVALAALLTVPIGFIIYQIYYRSEFKCARCGIAVRDRGGQVLQCLQEFKGAIALPSDWDVIWPTEPDDAGKTHERHVSYFLLPAYRLGKLVRAVDNKQPTVWRKLVLIPSRWETSTNAKARQKARKAYVNTTRERWRMVRSLITQLSETDRGRALASEYTALSDIYHTLGACRTAVLLGGLVSPAFSVLVGPETSLSWRISIGFAIPIAALPLYFVLWRNREQTLLHLIGCVKHGLLTCLRAPATPTG